MNFISLADLVLPMNPQQRILTTWFYAAFNNDSTIHKKILNVEPLFYQGVIRGSEFLIYNVSKLYLCLSIFLDHSTPESDIDPVVNFYDSDDNPFFQFERTTLGLNIATLIDHGQTGEITNMYFSRFAVTHGAPYINVKFIGYRITLN
jgi:hypothetical protein